jgi:hypothetical protein
MPPPFWLIEAALERGGSISLEPYVEQRWKISRPRAYQLIAAAQVVETVSTVVDIVPVNEAQARPLTALSPEQQAEVWQEAVKTAPPSGITAKHVQATVRRVKGQTAEPKVNKPKAPEPEPRAPSRKVVQDELVGILKVVDDQAAWPILATLWIGCEAHYRSRPHITESALEVCLNALNRLIPLFPPSTAESFKLGEEFPLDAGFVDTSHTTAL